MLRKYSIWTRYLFIQSSLAIKKPQLAPIAVSFSTKPQMANSLFVKKPVFTSPKTIEQSTTGESAKTKANTPKTNSTYLIDNIMESSLLECKTLLSSESPKTDYSQSTLKALHSQLLASYNKMYKILSLQPDLENARRDAFKTKENYISNSAFRDEHLLIQFDGIATDLCQIYEMNKQNFLSNPGNLMYGVTCLSKFERFHENQKLWDIISRYLEKFLQEEKSHKQLDWNMMLSFLASVSRHRYYCRIQSKEKSSGEATRRRQKVQKLEKELFECIMRNTEHVNISGWAYILSNFYFTNDSFAEKVLDNLKHIAQLENNPQHLVKALVYLAKVNADQEINQIYNKIKDLVIESLQTNKISLNEISRLTKVFKNDKNFTDEDFNILWSTIRDQLDNKDFEGLTLYSLSMMITNLSAYKQFSQQHSLILQKYTLIALDKFDVNHHNLEQEEVDESEDVESSENVSLNNQVLNKGLIRPIISILGNLVRINDVQFLNPELFRRIFETIHKNVENIRKESFSDIIRFTGRFIEIISEKSNNDKTFKSLQNEAKIVYDLCHNKLQSESGTQRHRDIVQIFRRDCALGKMDETSFSRSETEIIKILDSIETNLCTFILEGINIIKTKGLNQNVNTDNLEEITVKKILVTLKSLSKEEFKILFTVFQPIINSKHSKQLDKTLRREFIDRIETFSIQESSKIIFGLNLKKLPKMNQFLLELAPFLNQKIDAANITDLFYIMATCRNSGLYAPKILPNFETILATELEKLLKAGPKASKQDSLREVVSIFQDFLLTEGSQENKLIKVFENVFRKSLSTFNLQQLTVIINGMTKYLSTDVSLLKDCLEKSDRLLNDAAIKFDFLKKARNTDLKALHQTFSIIELQYKQKIDLSQFKEISVLSLALPIHITSAEQSKEKTAKKKIQRSEK